MWRIRSRKRFCSHASSWPGCQGYGEDNLWECIAESKHDYAVAIWTTSLYLVRHIYKACSEGRINPRRLKPKLDVSNVDQRAQI